MEEEHGHVFLNAINDCVGALGGVIATAKKNEEGSACRFGGQQARLRELRGRLGEMGAEVDYSSSFVRPRPHFACTRQHFVMLRSHGVFRQGTVVSATFLVIHTTSSVCGK